MRRNNERTGSWALVHYRGGILGEPVTDDGMEGDPRRIEMGAGAVPLDVESALYDMEIGEKRTVIITPMGGYGEHDPNGVRIVQRQTLPNGQALEVGSVVKWRNPDNGLAFPVRVIMATQDYVKLDHNHPLAGKTLEYYIELIGFE